MSDQNDFRGISGPTYDNEKYVSGSPSFSIEQCKLAVDHSTIWHINNEDHKRGGKIIVDFADIDPNLVSATTDQYSWHSVTLRTNTASIRFVANEPSKSFAGSFVVITLSRPAAESQASVEKAIRHAVKLCGGKPSKF